MNRLNKFREYAAIAKLVTRPRRTTLQHHLPTSTGGPQKHCILLHGWGATGQDMHHWWEALSKTSAGQECHFWIPTYDSSWRTFAQSARSIKVLLESAPFDFQHTVILGYSMGGLVARELVRAGLPFYRLVTLCSPHHGAAPWVPILWRRTRTLSGNSSLIQQLNNASGDASLRERYHFWGLTYKDPSGTHQHDGIVEISSALGQNVQGDMERHTFSIAFKNTVQGLGLSGPHVCALYPHRIPQALEMMTGLLARVE